MAVGKTNLSDQTLLITLLLTCVLPILYGLYLNFQKRSNDWNREFLFRKLKSQYRLYLYSNFRFYRKLNAKKKIVFERRVQAFIDAKEFTWRGKSGYLSDETKVLIAGSAIQITFGFPTFYFPHFQEIYVYPKAYYNQSTKQVHEGEVNLKGIIVLSEENLKQGWKNDADGVNLGLHEMAHAFNFENFIENGEDDFISEDNLLRLRKFALVERKKIKAHANPFFRDYSAANLQEFFAVCAENFFERPEEFQNYNADLYRLLTTILRQNPLSL